MQEIGTYGFVINERRQRIATAALAGLLSSALFSYARDDDERIEPKSGETVPQYLARAAVDYADALIAELDKVK